MTDLATQIGKLLGDDPVCGGRVCQGTAEAIAALVSPPPPEAVKGLVEALLDNADFLHECLLKTRADKNREAATALQSYAAEVERLREALEEIARGQGAFSRDPLEHAENTIDDMKEIARAALTKGGDRG